MMVEVEQKEQRGSLASSQAKMAGEESYRETTVAMYSWYVACAAEEVYQDEWLMP